MRNKFDMTGSTPHPLPSPRLSHWEMSHLLSTTVKAERRNWLLGTGKVHCTNKTPYRQKSEIIPPHLPTAMSILHLSLWTYFKCSNIWNFPTVKSVASMNNTTHRTRATKRGHWSLCSLLVSLTSTFLCSSPAVCWEKDHLTVITTDALSLCYFKCYSCALFF